MNRFGTNRTMRYADTSIKQTQVVIDFSNGRNGTARITARRLLVYRNSWAETIDTIDIWFVHNPKKLSRVATQRLNIATLTFSVDSVKDKRGLTAPAQTSYYHQLISRNLHVDILQIMFSRTTNTNYF